MKAHIFFSERQFVRVTICFNFWSQNETNWSVLVDNHPKKHPEESHEGVFKLDMDAVNAYPVCHCVNVFKQPKLTSLVLPPKVIVVAFSAAPKGHLKSKGDAEKNEKMKEMRRPRSTVRPPSWHNGRIIRYLMILYDYIIYHYRFLWYIDLLSKVYMSFPKTTNKYEHLFNYSQSALLLLCDCKDSLWCTVGWCIMQAHAKSTGSSFCPNHFCRKWGCFKNLDCESGWNQRWHLWDEGTPQAAQAAQANPANQPSHPMGALYSPYVELDGLSSFQMEKRGSIICVISREMAQLSRKKVIFSYIDPRKSKDKTLRGSRESMGISYMDHPKDQPFCLVPCTSRVYVAALQRKHLAANLADVSSLIFVCLKPFKSGRFWSSKFQKSTRFYYSTIFGERHPKEW